MRSRTTSGGGGGEMVTARLLTNCSNTLRNIHTKARENITRTRGKRKAGYFFVAHSVALGSTQPLTEMSTRNISWEEVLKAASV